MAEERMDPSRLTESVIEGRTHPERDAAVQAMRSREGLDNPSAARPERISGRAMPSRHNRPER